MSSRNYNIVSGILTYIIPFSIIIYAIYFMVKDGSIYAISQVPFTKEYVHSYSLICFVLSYVVFQRTLIHIPIVARTIVSFILIAFHGYLGGFVWDANNFIINGIYNIMILIDVAGLVWFYVILMYLNKKFHIFKKEPTKRDQGYTFLLFLAQCYGYILLYMNGFWKYFAMNYIPYTGDPNANINWLFMRTTTFFLLYFLLERGKETNTSLEAPKLV